MLQDSASLSASGLCSTGEWARTSAPCESPKPLQGRSLSSRNLIWSLGNKPGSLHLSLCLLHLEDQYTFLSKCMIAYSRQHSIGGPPCLLIGL